MNRLSKLLVFGFLVALLPVTSQQANAQRKSHTYFAAQQCNANVRRFFNHHTRRWNVAVDQDAGRPVIDDTGLRPNIIMYREGPDQHLVAKMMIPGDPVPDFVIGGHTYSTCGFSAVQSAPAPMQPAAPSGSQNPACAGANPDQWAATQLQVSTSELHEITSEPCSWVFQTISHQTAVCPTSWGCTLASAVDPSVKLYFGDNSSRSAKVGTFRYLAAFPSGDARRNFCTLLKGEDYYGMFVQKTAPPYHTLNGNFTGCPMVTQNASPSLTAQQSGAQAPPSQSGQTQCPVFGGVKTSLSGKNCLFSSPQPVQDKVPVGFTADYWDSPLAKAVYGAPAGTMITTVTATFKPVA